MNNAAPATTILINRHSIIRIAGMRHTQSVSTVRDGCSTWTPNGHLSIEDARDKSEKRARGFGHDLAYCVPHAIVLTSHYEEPPTIIEIESGTTVTYIDEEGNTHTVKLSKPRYNDQGKLEYIAGPLA